MVAPTRVNKGTPQEPTTPPGPVAGGVTQAEAVTEDPAGPATDFKEPAAALGEAVPGDLEEPAGDLEEAVPAEAAPTGSAVTELVPAQAVPAQAEPVEAELAEATTAIPEAAEPGPAEADQAEPDAVEPEPAEVKSAEPERAEAENTKAGPNEAELAGSELAPAVLAEETGEAGEAREASRDVGPLAVVGIIVGVIVLVGVAAGILAMVTHGFKPKTVVTYRPAAVYGLHPGQCVNAGSNSLSFTLVSCAGPHDAEVFARFALPAAAWPGSSAVRQQAGDGCASRLSGYLNPQLASIGLTQEYVYPNRDAWQAGQRTVVCEVSSGNGRLTGSVRAKS
jgi:Septum formation